MKEENKGNVVDLEQKNKDDIIDVDCKIIKETETEKKPRREMKKDPSEKRAIIDFFLWRAGKHHSKEKDYREHNLKNKNKKFETQPEVFKKIKKLSSNINISRLRPHFNKMVDGGEIIMNEEIGLFVVNLTPLDDVPGLKRVVECVLSSEVFNRKIFGKIENARVGDGDLMENVKGIFENATPLITEGKEAFEKLEDSKEKEDIKKQKDNSKIKNLVEALGLSTK